MSCGTFTLNGKYVRTKNKISPAPRLCKKTVFIVPKFCPLIGSSQSGGENLLTIIITINTFFFRNQNSAVVRLDRPCRRCVCSSLKGDTQNTIPVIVMSLSRRTWHIMFVFASICLYELPTMG